MTTTPTASSELKIGGINETTILRYFETLNAGDFDATVALFAPEGIMHPPFESDLVGHEAIATYLKAEAKDLKVSPREGIIEPVEGENSHSQVQVSGTAQTSWCGVNVSWQFILNENQEILYTRIKLLASPQELFKLRR